VNQGYFFAAEGGTLALPIRPGVTESTTPASPIRLGVPGEVYV